MTDSRYSYEKINAVKILLENKEGKILLIKEPDNNEWMPGHWGLPGGQALKKESLYDTFRRKLKGELGVESESSGIYKIEQLLNENKTTFIFHIVVRIEGEIAIKGEINEFKWVEVKDIKAMNIRDFTEYFNKSLILEYLTGSKETVDFSLIETQDYYNLENDRKYLEWFESGKKLTPKA